MKYYEVKDFIDSYKLKKLEKQLISSGKNTSIDLYRDYYDATQWMFNGGNRSTVTRSGKVMWNFKNKDGGVDGFTRGELKVWNVVQPAIDIYAAYVRGSIEENTKITFKEHEDLAEKMNDAIGDKDSLVMSTTRRMGVDSLTVWRMYDEGGIEIIESKEYIPIYYDTQRVGSIRCYPVDSNDPIVKENAESGISQAKNARHVYCEIWMPQDITADEPKMYCWKYLDDVLIDDGLLEKNYDPFIVVINKKDEYRDFDENGLAISDVEQILDIQDDINAYVTDLSIINRQVAIPMYTLTKDIWEKIAAGELTGDQVQGELEKLTLIAGSIINAPIEKMPAEGLPASSVQHLADLFDQYFRIVGIPKSFFNSEGLGNIADDTLVHLMESMKRNTDAKRTNIESAFKEYGRKYMIANDITEGMDEIEDSLSVYWAQMISPSRMEKADMIVKFSNLLPQQYLMEKAVDIFGDSEKLKQIIGYTMSNSLTVKTDIETKMIEEQMKKDAEEAGANTNVNTEAKKEPDRKLLTQEANNIKNNA